MQQTSITADDVRFLSALAHQPEAASRTAAGDADPTAVAPGAAQAAGIGRFDEAVASMNMAIDYMEIATGRRRTVLLVHPAQADAGAGRVSVLSPVGRALLGCAVGDHADAQLPNGQPLRLLVSGVRAEARCA